MTTSDLGTQKGRQHCCPLDCQTVRVSSSDFQATDQCIRTVVPWSV